MLLDIIDDDITAISGLRSEDAFWYMSAACLHARTYLNWTLEDLERLFIPPILAGNVRFFSSSRDPSQINAFCTWAWLSTEASQRVKIAHLDPQPHEWNSGEELWIIDMVSPNAQTAKVVRYLQQAVFKGGVARQAHALRRNASGKVRKIGTWPVPL